MSNQEYPAAPRRRRSERHQDPGAPAAGQGRETPLRAGYPPEGAAPPPPYGYDATRPVPPPPPRPAPRVYEEAEYQPPRRDPSPYAPRYEDEYDEEDLPPRRWPMALLALFLALAVILAVSYFLIPKDAKGILGTARGLSHQVVDGALGLVGVNRQEPARLLKFDTPEDKVQTGVKTVFTFTASRAIDGVRIWDEADNEIPGVQEAVDAPANTVWTLTSILDTPREGPLTAGFKQGDAWHKTDLTVLLTVSAPTPTPSPTTEPTFTPPPVFQPTPEAFSGVLAPPPEPQTPSLQALLPAFTPLPGETGAPGTDMKVITSTDWHSPLQTAEPAAPFEPAAPVEPMEPVEPVEPIEPVEPVAPIEPAVPVEPIESVEPMEPVEPAAPTAAPTATPMPALTAQAAEAQGPGRMNVTETAYRGAKGLGDYTRETPLNVQGGEGYTYYPGGVFTFRGDGMRQNAAFGTADMALEQLSVLWQAEVGSLRTSDSGTLYGLGWTGQPAIVKWPIEVREMMNLNEEKKAVRALKEVIFAAQDGKVYFLDLNDGKPTREPFDVGFPLKGSVSVDPMGRPLAAFGQGISKLPGKTGDIGFFIYNLVDGSRAEFINGRKTKNQLQYATNGAFDGTALFDRFSDSLVVAGENGLIYTVTLNTVFDVRDTKTLTVDPDVTYLRTKAGKQPDNSVSIEASAAMYGPYAFVADKRGIVRCVDTTTMKTVWAFDTGDNTDATPALDLEGDSVLALYTGTTVFDRSRRDGVAVLRRLDALTGQEAWKVEIKAKYDKGERSGLKASPLVGREGIGHLVLFTLNKTEEGGALVALNKATGEQAWKLPLAAGSVSSPVAVYTPDGRARVIQADAEGRLFLLDGASGQVLFTLELGGPVEGSPAVYNDVLVIGTSGRENSRMYGIRLE